MERVIIEPMPLAGRKPLSGYVLSHMAIHLRFYQPSLRYPKRVDRIKSNVLRALCDRYPNCWAGVPDIAEMAKCSEAQARRVLRELEYKDRLIVDINSRLSWHRRDGKWDLQSDNAGKKGGTGETVQYFICDRKIYDIYQAQKAEEKAGKTKRATQSGETPNAGEHPNQGSNNPTSPDCPAQSGENPNPIRGASKHAGTPSPLIGEPTTLITNHKNQPPPTSENLWGRMVDDWKEVRKENLSKAGWKKVPALADGDTIVRAWAYWIKNRILDGLLHPLIMFVEEFPETLAALQRHDQQQATKAATARQVQESAKTCAQWRDNLEAFAKQATSVEIDSWVKTNPAPPMLVQADEGITAVVYADSIISMCKFMAEKRAEKDSQRRHDPEDSFCACPDCQPDFWAPERDGAFNDLSAA